MFSIKLPRNTCGGLSMAFSGGVTVVKPGDSFEHWHQVTCRNFSLTESSRPSAKEFCAQVSLREFWRLGLSEISSSTPSDRLVRVTRSPSDIRRDPRDYFMLWFGLGGETAFVQGGHETQILAGDLMLHDQTQPFSLEFGRQAHAFMISIPRPLILSRLPTASQLTARRISTETKLGAFAGSIVRQLFDLNVDQSDELAARVGASAIDLVTAALENELRGPSVVVDRRLERVKRYMMANIGDTELTLETIATNQNISPRTLNRLFALEGTTPIRWLWQQRLTAAFRMLSEKRTSRVTDVAFVFGFSDVAHFSRAFKAAFGQSPDAVRRGQRTSQ
jgi:AraC-like DNA-binding protein